MSNEIYRALQFVSSFSSVIPFLIVLGVIKRLEKKYFSLALLIVIAFLTEICNTLFVKYGYNNYLLLRGYSVLEIILLCWFYRVFFARYFRSIYFLAPIPLFFIIAYVDYRVNGSNSFDNYAVAFESITFSIIALWSFYYIIKGMIFENIILAPFFWFNTAIILYFGGNLILFVFDNYLLKYQTSSHLAMWGIHSVLNIIYNIVLAIGFWKTRRP